MSDQSTNMITAYHEVQQDTYDEVRAHGILGNESSDKDTEPIEQTNEFLDHYRPEQKSRPLPERCTAIYCYLAHEEDVIDITTGDVVAPESIADDEHILLRVRIPADSAYVSDLDAYDAVKDALEQEDEELALSHAHFYWERVTPYADYRLGTIARPELMVTEDIAPSAIEPVNS